MPTKSAAKTLKDPFMAAFKEEEACLRKVEKKLDSIVERKNDAFTKAQSELGSFVAYDYSDLTVKKELIDSADKKRADLNKWKAYKDSPYFGRLEMTDDSGKTHSYLIGNEVIGEGTDLIVLDWRDDLAKVFYRKRELHFSVKGINYDLRLRRAVTIKEAKLKAVNTEYDYSDWTPKGEIIDPFLLSVLEDKRRDYKLTDIIRTIQANQNDIIERPLEENFIVQGCAGSGKTMILLHRLSTIAFNHPKIDFSRFFIITPNNNFNIHVNELSKQLGLDKIKRYTAEEFYAWLIERRIETAAGSDAAKRTHRSVLKPTTDKLLSEKLLDSELLAYLYSAEFYEKTSETFRRRSLEAIEKLRKLQIPELLRKHHYSISERSEMNSASYMLYFETIGDVLQRHTTSNDSLQQINKSLIASEEKYTDALHEKENAEGLLKKTKSDLLALCESRITISETELQAIQESENKARADFEHANQEKDALFARIRTIEESLRRIEHGVDGLSSESYLNDSSEEIAIVIRKECTEQLSQMRATQEELNALVFYNFGKRARLRSMLNDALQSFRKQVSIIAANYQVEKNKELSEIRNRIGEWDNKIAQINRELSSVAGRVRATQATIMLYSACHNAFSMTEYPDLEKTLSRTDYASLANVVEEYRACLRAYKTSERGLQVATATHERYQSDYSKIQAGMLEDEDYRAFLEGYEVVKQFDIASLYKEFENSVQAVYRQHGQKYLRTPNYRHRLYLKLLFSTLYYGVPQTGDYYLNIDEAQDFAPTELKLLKAALGNRVVFNLYGDVNQAIYEYKGIMDWSDLQELTSNTVYHLNENYRNTLEITDYCNTEFEADVTAVGLSGAPVRQLAIEKACAALNSLHSANPSMRCAVIYKRGVEGLLEELTPLLPSIHVGYLSNNTTAISCLTVEECKGLEFDAALVVTNEMSVNEKYIAFTRALDHLILTSSKKAFFSGDDNAIPEDIPDDELTESTPISIVANVEDEQETEQESVGNQADPSVELPKQPIDISIKDSTPYIRAFFSEDLRLVDAFNELVHHIQQADSSVMIRAKDEYIGFARKGERCIMYVSRKGANFFVKFIHLYSPEKLEGEKISQYHRLLDQALNYSKQFSVKLK